jgi:hypothetical protein
MAWKHEGLGSEDWSQFGPGYLFRECRRFVRELPLHR